MKKLKLLLVLAAVLLGGTAANAQMDWNAGGGYAMTTFRGQDCSAFLTSHTLHGFYAGVSHEFYFSALAGLTFEPGLYFNYQSGRNDGDAHPKFIKMHYLGIPLNVKYTFDMAPGLTATFFTGPAFNVGIAGNLFQKQVFITNRDPADPMRALSRVNVQWGFGLGVTIAQAVQIRIGYAVGLSRLIPEQSIHNNSFTVGAGFLF